MTIKIKRTKLVHDGYTKDGGSLAAKIRVERPLEFSVPNKPFLFCKGDSLIITNSIDLSIFDLIKSVITGKPIETKGCDYE